MVQELIPSRGFQSSMDYVMTLGLGNAKLLDSLRVIWPDDATQKLSNVEVNQFLTLKRSDADSIYRPIKEPIKKTLLTELSNERMNSHKENNHIDFDYEGLISKMLSQEGPALAIGDINGDGNEDIYIGGAKGQSGILYLHKGGGIMKPFSQLIFEVDRRFEDTTAAFLDVDGDGDQDLMVGSGGNEVEEANSYRPRLYLNDGKGVFKKAKKDLPPANVNSSVISPFDFDDDGDMDVFIGARSIVATYGLNPGHLFLENIGDGTFRDASERLAYDLKDAGMVTDAIWTDVDGDGRKDLVTVSEWDVPKVYKNSGRRLSKTPTSLDSLHGWWNAVEVADLDLDGDNDLILGNQGNNLHYRPSPDNPMKLWINDFDENGTIEQIMTLNKEGKSYPLHQKRELTNQMVALKKQNLKASDYATRNIQELFSKEVVDNSIVKTATVSESMIAVNEGDGKFSIKKLPYRVQLSSVCGITCVDINNDGYLDLVMGGNDFEFKPQYSRLDASFGNVLLGDGKLGFKWQDYNKSGFSIRNEIEHLKTFKDKNGNQFIIAAINDAKPRIFQVDEE